LSDRYGRRDRPILKAFHSSSQAGSVSARANKYNLCSRMDDDLLSRGLQHAEHGHGAAEELESAVIGGNMLVMAGAGAEEVCAALHRPSGCGPCLRCWDGV